MKSFCIECGTEIDSEEGKARCEHCITTGRDTVTRPIFGFIRQMNKQALAIGLRLGHGFTIGAVLILLAVFEAFFRVYEIGLLIPIGLGCLYIVSCTILYLKIRKEIMQLE